MIRGRLVAFLIGTLALATLVGGTVAAATLGGSTPGSPSPHASVAQHHPDREAQSGEEDAGEVHGGTVARFHGGKGTSCDVPGGTRLSGNWTHGDYVTAWAGTGDAVKVRDAAHSPCGKPAHAVARPAPPRGIGSPQSKAKVPQNVPSKVPQKVPPPEPQPPGPS